MKTYLLAAAAFMCMAICVGQEAPMRDTLSNENNKYVVGLLPSKANNIYGLAVGLIGSESICNKPYTKYSHGLNVQLPGQGFLQLFYIFNPSFHNIIATHKYEKALKAMDTTLKKAVHNGLLVSLMGTFSDKINGVSLSAFMSLGKQINGVTLNPLWNMYYRVHGVSLGAFNTALDIKGMQIGLVNNTAKLKGAQFGLVNKTEQLKGVQIGLWNKNSKRALPLINWDFGD